MSVGRVRRPGKLQVETKKCCIRMRTELILNRILGPGGNELERLEGAQYIPIGMILRNGFTFRQDSVFKREG